jgi:kinesin family protein 22
VQLADALSPVSKKKTGRAYVALARAHSEKYVPTCYSPTAICLSDLLTASYYRGDLQVALDLYRKAENYVPDNVKLKERWILFVVHVFLVKLSRKF